MKTKIEVASYKGRRYHGWIKGLIALVLAGVLAFGALFVAVMSGARDHVSGDPQIMIVLGCQVKPWGPSILLQDRLDEALDYWEDHPDILIVVSGGQGPDEPSTEARAMADYLMEQGVSAEQLLLEEESHNTFQNLACTFELLKETGYEDQMGQVLVVSNGFHLTRVRMLFGRVWEGDCTLSTLAAPTSHIPSRLKMYVREPLALAKSFLFDR